MTYIALVRLIGQARSGIPLLLSCPYCATPRRLILPQTCNIAYHKICQFGYKIKNNLMLLLRSRLVAECQPVLTLPPRHVTYAYHSCKHIVFIVLYFNDILN